MPPLPKALKPGDLIEVVSPSSGLAAEKMVWATEWLEKEGYRVRFAPHALEQDDYLAGRDEDRAADLMAAFRDPDVDAVMCARGGYGAARLFPFIDLDEIAESGKQFLGFSDITTLHVALNRRGMVTMHAPMMLTLSVQRDSWTYVSLSNVLKGENPVPQEAPKAVPIVGGIAEGPVVGGCLCLLCDTFGTPNELDVRGRVLIIEDVDENPHRVDAMFTHLVNSGCLREAAGIAVGEMTGTDERVDAGIGGKPWREIVRNRLEPLGKPLVFDLPFGHRKQGMLTLPMETPARLNADTGELTYLEAYTQ